jgi:DNA modification methylase
MNQIYYGDNLQVLREHIANESVELIYLDPPFNSKRNYNLLLKSPKGVRIEAFEDTWHWTQWVHHYQGRSRHVGKPVGLVEVFDGTSEGIH